MLHHQVSGSRSEGTTVLWNVRDHTPDDRAPHHSRPKSILKSIWNDCHRSNLYIIHVYKMSFFKKNMIKFNLSFMERRDYLYWTTGTLLPHYLHIIYTKCIEHIHIINQILCSVDHASLYNLINETNLVHYLFLAYFVNFIYNLYMFWTWYPPHQTVSYTE